MITYGPFQCLKQHAFSSRCYKGCSKPRQDERIAEMIVPSQTQIESAGMLADINKHQETAQAIPNFCCTCTHQILLQLITAFTACGTVRKKTKTSSVNHRQNMITFQLRLTLKSFIKYCNPRSHTVFFCLESWRSMGVSVNSCKQTTPHDKTYNIINIEVNGRER